MTYQSGRTFLRRTVPLWSLIALLVAASIGLSVSTGKAAANGMPPLRAVHFVDRQSGWVAGEGILLATDDGGASWSVERTGAFTITQIHFADRQHGWAIGSDVAFFTRDGGAEWQAVNLPGEGRSRRVDFADPLHGWLSDGVALYATEDGGNTWRSIATPAPPLATCRLSASEGWFASDRGVYLSLDGGETWELRFDPQIEEYPGWRADLQCVDGALWLLYLGDVAMHQMAYVAFLSPDSGESWAPQLSRFYFGDAYPNVQELPSIHAQAGPFAALDGNTAHFFGFCSPCLDRFLLVSTFDGGETWRRIDAPEVSYFESALFFLDAEHGWLVAPREFEREGVLFQTEDGGKTWEPVALPASLLVGSE